MDADCSTSVPLVDSYGSFNPSCRLVVGRRGLLSGYQKSVRCVWGYILSTNFLTFIAPLLHLRFRPDNFPFHMHPLFYFFLPKASRVIALVVVRVLWKCHTNLVSVLPVVRFMEAFYFMLEQLRTAMNIHLFMLLCLAAFFPDSNREKTDAYS